MTYDTIQVRFQQNVCFITFYRPEANNTINDRLVEECLHVLSECEASVTVVVLEGLPEVFCFGADFGEMYQKMRQGIQHAETQEPLYRLWLALKSGPYITIAHVRGKVNAGGVGFAAASDIVIADESASFSLSELLFGLFPACVLPFLIQRIGFQKAHYMTIMTKPVSVRQAQEWGLADVCSPESGAELRKHLLRLRLLSKKAVIRYKQYMDSLNDLVHRSKSIALAENQAMFSDRDNQAAIIRYAETGRLPWENENS
ncbi:enoyl-CoA hydratase/isomerase [Bacillus sp. ISL-51]|uniref:enoyl-CoA hydratase/isomerase n=1 Tax=Bacteria TaxID=2 RepID=UPI001BEABEF6|nr:MULTISPECIES: enoyl-CoA hydratase/isomerase [unclassified Bacillus (in: firmicutes)]MBT2575232.1 enoyl-CoA hydratase/isomerase [Bacillus sp. ISL-51]MBT2633525.1 enoyl-CoA hydratase/isomerase [Bacillus sp. ISL-26]MBT2714039.1 enoyl-CoA hydratase/isomerase [Pseudomonas sp. ISL-88]